MEVISTNTVKATYDKNSHVLHVQLNDQVVSADLRNTYVQALQFARSNNIKHWLLDMRNIEEISEQDTDWMHTAFYPKVMSLLKFTNYFGMVVSKKSYQNLLRSAGRSGLKSYNSFIRIQAFSDANKALNWLYANKA